MIRNKERILKIYSDLDRFFSDLKAISLKNKEDLNDNLKFHATSMLLFSILQRTIDLGEEVIFTLGLPLPGSHKEVFEILSNAKVVTKEELEKLKFMVNFRNLIAHQYYAFGDADIFEVYSNLGIITKFVEKSKKVFRENEK